MEKLIILIDTYEEEVVWVHSVWEKITDKEEARIISKKFWFIQWLVENEKIDLDACEWEKTYNNLTASRDSNYTQYERLLMALAIQDNPIEFLVSILK